MLGNTERKRLLKLANFIKNIPRKKFDLGVIAEERDSCGTVCCAIGYCPVVFPRNFKYVRDEYGQINVELKTYGGYDFTAARSFFKLTHNEADFLFMPSCYAQNGDAPPKVVAKRIEDFANGVIRVEDIEYFTGDKETDSTFGQLEF